MDQNQSGGERHIFDNPRNIRRLLLVLYAICAALVVADFFIDRHHHGPQHPWEIVPAFYAIYGFVACVILVLAATQMRKLVMRKEEYYDR